MTKTSHEHTKESEHSKNDFPKIESLPFSHPLYLHPSDTQGNTIIQQVLTGTENYTVWSKAMKISLKGKQKLGFVEGTCRKEDQEDYLQDQWERCNAVVLSWILNSLSKDLANGMVYFQDSYLLWEELRERFDKISGSRLFSLHREITLLSQGSLSVAAYYTRLKDLWEEQSSLLTVPCCSCVSTQSYAKAIQQQKLLQFLMGLNNRHYHARSQILLMDPLPSVNHAYSMIYEDEAQKIVAQGGSVNDPTQGLAMITTGRGRGRAGRGRGRGGSILECDYCHKKGHTREFCYQLVGYPSESKSNKKEQEVKALPVDTEFANEGQIITHKAGVVSPSFTQEQYETILELIRQKEEGSVLALAGTGLNSSNTVRNSHIFWLFDSGATAHMVGDLSLLQSYSKYSGPVKNIKIPDGTLLPVTHQGIAKISEKLVLRNVLYAPNLKFNLISVSKLTSDSHCFATFYRDRCILQDFQSQRMMATGRMIHGLYLLNVDDGLAQCISVSNSVFACKDIKAILLHNRMGHAPMSILKRLHFVTNKIDDFDGKCDVCFQSKQTKLPFPTSTIKSVRPFELLHLDVWGPYQRATHAGFQYFLTIVDDFSRATWLFLMRHKSETTSHIKYYLAHVGTQFSVSIKKNT